MLIERLLANLSVTVEPFALCEVEEGCDLPLDEQDTVTIHFMLRGTGAVQAGGWSVAFSPNTLVLVPHKRRHVLSATTDEGHRSPATPPEGIVRLQSFGERGEPDVVSACGHLQARYGNGPALFGLLTEPIVLDFSDSDEMNRLFADMLTESASKEPGSKVMLAALMNRCMVIMFRRLCGSEECPLPWLNALDDERMSAALAQMLEHPERDHSVESLAEAAAMSRTTFAEAFKANFGSPPMTFLREVRLRKAADLLNDSGVNMRLVASKVGFSSRAHFSTAFKEQFGVPPGEYRRLLQEPAGQA